jgi:ferredoxin
MVLSTGRRVEPSALEPPHVGWPGRFGKKRLSILRAAAAVPHRYRAYRAAAMAVSIGVLALGPLIGLARVDLIAIGIAIFVLYFVTFNVNLVAGRMFCGWGCPIGQLNRLTDTFAAQSNASGRWRWGSAVGGFAFASSLAVVLWWTSFGAIALAASIACAAAAVLFARVWGWSFCRKLCPIGLYYSVVQTERPLGILHDRSRCLDEGACVRACPVQLDARSLSSAKRGIGGLAIEGLPENNHCLRCGACVEACEIVTSKLEAPALFFGRPAPKIEPLIQIVRVHTPTPIVEARSEGMRTPRSVQIILVVAVLSGVAAYAAIAAKRSTRYQPAQTWSSSESRISPRYVPAASFEKTTLRGVAPPHAIVHLDRPRPGRALPPPIERELRIEGRRFSEPLYLASTQDRLKLSNADPDLHTIHASAGRRSAMNAALPGGKSRVIGAPSPGLYRITCDRHPGEQAELLVLDHPYVTRAGADGEYTLEEVPAGSADVVVYEPKATQP